MQKTLTLTLSQRERGPVPDSPDLKDGDPAKPKPSAAEEASNPKPKEEQEKQT